MPPDAYEINGTLKEVALCMLNQTEPDMMIQMDEIDLEELIEIHDVMKAVRDKAARVISIFISGKEQHNTDAKRSYGDRVIDVSQFRDEGMAAAYAFHFMKDMSGSELQILRSIGALRGNLERALELIKDLEDDERFQGGKEFAAAEHAIGGARNYT